MPTLPQLLRSRQRILDRIGRIEEMRRGSVTRQFLRVRRKGEPEPALLGPYALYTRKVAGRTVSRRLRTDEQVRRVEQQVENHHAFQALCAKLVELGEAIADERDKGRTR